MNGLLLVDKPEGISSHDIVDKIRKILNVKKIGHTGTLDPAATGLLLLCIGKATKLVEFLQDFHKIYEGEITFGITTDTLDKEGEIVEKHDASNLKKGDVEKIFSSFQGEIRQTPPIFSAIHWKGERLYKLAKKGIKVKISERKVFIYKLELLNFFPSLHPRAEFQLKCSKGTYIRSFCRDIGEALGCGAFQSFLKRIQIGPFALKKAVKIEDLEKMNEAEVKNCFYSLKEALPHFPVIKVKKEAEKLIKWGRPLYLSHVENLSLDLEKGDRVRLCSKEGDLLSIGMSLQNATHFSEDRIAFKCLKVLV